MSQRRSSLTACLTFALLLAVQFSLVDCFRGNFLVPKMIATSIPHSAGVRNITLGFQLIDQIDSNRAARCSVTFLASDGTNTSTNTKTLAVPSQDRPARCDDAGFTFYFVNFESIRSFTMNAAHSYHDPAVGEGYVTYFAYGNPLNSVDFKLWTCAAIKGFEFCKYDSDANPVVLPVMAAVA